MLILQPAYKRGNVFKLSKHVTFKLEMDRKLFLLEIQSARSLVAAIDVQERTQLDGNMRMQYGTSTGMTYNVEKPRRFSHG